VLVPVTLGVFTGMMLTHVFAVTLRVISKPGNGVELVVAHDRLRRPGIDHAPNKIYRLALFGSAVDEVSNEEGLPLRMTPSATCLRVPQLDKQSLKSIRVSMDISNNVVVHCMLPVITLGNLMLW
jgi:hypothetical protein